MAKRANPDGGVTAVGILGSKRRKGEACGRKQKAGVPWTDFQVCVMIGYGQM